MSKTIRNSRLKVKENLKCTLNPWYIFHGIKPKIDFYATVIKFFQLYTFTLPVIICNKNHLPFYISDFGEICNVSSLNRSKTFHVLCHGINTKDLRYPYRINQTDLNYMSVFRYYKFVKKSLATKIRHHVIKKKYLSCYASPMQM